MQIASFGQSSEEEIQRLKLSAKVYEERAIQADAMASYSKREADRMKNLSIAHEVAEKSIEIKDLELSSLLALHAYNFNFKYQGYQFESKIYYALSEALKRHGLLPKKLENTLPPFATNETDRTVLQNRILNRILSRSTFDADVVSFSSSGKFVAIACSDLFIRIWNLEALNQQSLVIGGLGKISSISFSTNESQLILFQQSKNNKSKIAISFPFNFAEMANELCGLMKRNLTTEEWGIFVAEDLPIEKTCVSLKLGK